MPTPRDPALERIMFEAATIELVRASITITNGLVDCLQKADPEISDTLGRAFELASNAMLDLSEHVEAIRVLLSVKEADTDKRCHMATQEIRRRTVQ